MNEPRPDLIDHAIQKEIVRTLVSKSQAKYSELKPARVESNLFMYHVNQLIKRGVVDKQDGIYTLTTLGNMYVDRANLDKLVFRVQPKIVTILAVRSGDGNWLLLERKHEPHMGRVGFPSGKIHYGETLDESAVRELEEKAGIKAPLQLAGNIVMRFMDKSGTETVNHTIGYIYQAELKDEPELRSDSKYWQAFWGDEERLLNGNVFKGHGDILELLASGQVFIQSLDYKSDY